MLRYRADIDGLRAVAILPILLFHAGVSQLRGGYTGVDVFFVISGFLITQILLQDLTAERFSIARFYQRRIARILPPLFVVLAFVAALAAPIVVLPGDIAEIQRSVAAAAGFVSNIFFWWQIDYFARAAESQPLLHSWSLGVEEQFYIFFPLLLFLLRGASKRRLLIALGVIALLSFCGGLWVQQRSPQSDFYLLPFRAWELLLGGMVGIGVLPRLGNRLRVLAALGGVAMVGASVVLLATWLPFPAPFALLPVIGTALIIGYGETTIVGRVLAWAPVRWVGQISYSLYLWHWPIITYYRYLTGDELDLRETALLIGASVAAAAASYYLIELRAQRWLRGMSAGRAIAIGLAGVTIAIAVPLTLAANAHRIWPISAEAARIASFEDYEDLPHDEVWDESMACFVRSKRETLDVENCLTPAAGKRNVVLLGDSHANMYAPALRRRFPDINLMQATYFGCPPVLRGSYDPGCTAMVERVIGPLAKSGRIDGVILVSRWRFNQTAQLTQTVQALRKSGIAVTVIGPVTEYEGAFPALLARAIEAGQLQSVRRFLKHDRLAADRAIRAAAVAGGARYLSAYDTICPAGACRLVAKDGVPMFFDYGHLTDEGAEVVIAELPLP